MAEHTPATSPAPTSDPANPAFAASDSGTADESEATPAASAAVRSDGGAPSSTTPSTLTDEARIRTLRRRLLARKDQGLSGGSLNANPVITARALRTTEGLGSWQLRRGVVVRERLRATRFALDELELLAGRVAADTQAGPAAEQEEARAYLADFPAPPGQTGHCELDLDPLMTLGIDGLRERIRAARHTGVPGTTGDRPRARQRTTEDASMDTDRPHADATAPSRGTTSGAPGIAGAGADADAAGTGTDISTAVRTQDDVREDAYASFDAALAGLSAMIGNAARSAEDAFPDASAERRDELTRIAASCRRIAHAPPETFRDAIQLLWFAIMGVMHGEPVGLVVPGHLDRTLYPFYQRDTATGELDEADALLLIESLYLLVNEYIPDGLAISVMVGGRDAEGNDVTNALSYLCLEALRRTALIYPTVGICWHEGTPEELVSLAIDLIGHGNANPALFGDETIQRGLVDLGVPAEEACRYVNSTCVEITPSGASNVWVASPYYNTCQLLLEEIAAQCEAPSSDFASFQQRYRQRLAAAVEEGVAQQNEARRQRQRHGRKPLQSVFTRDCLARGRDIDDGGALYNWAECSFVGLANLADSLQVIETEIYDRGTLDFPRLKALLDTDFADAEPIRQRLLNGHPKYGQGCARVDQRVAASVAWVTDLCRRHRLLPDDSAYVPGAFVWIMHERLGQATGATPDGRRAGFPFADGCGPAQGRETRGPTAAILSTTSWDHSPMIGGLAYNMKFNTSLSDGPEGFARLQELVLTFLRRGGFETQINVVDAAVLERARAHPEEHRDLVVRIGGYTDYFTRLTPEMQAEVILRTEFDHA